MCTLNTKPCTPNSHRSPAGGRLALVFSYFFPFCFESRSFPLPSLHVYQVKTRDLGGYCTTNDFVKSVIDNLHPRRLP
ncbi:UNVERIFIED_CONTAM: hypothetical protein FKN15_067728 [Acipenser sinensis]